MAPGGTESLQFRIESKLAETVVKNHEFPGPVHALGQLGINHGRYVLVHVIEIMEQELEHTRGAAGSRHELEEAALAGGLGLAVQVAIPVGQGEALNAVMHPGGPGQADEAGRLRKETQLPVHLFRGEPVGLNLPDILVTQ
jgi:hypothetical protein